MNEKIQLKDGVKIHQPLATRDWRIGVMIGIVPMADTVGMALIRTDFGEYEIVPLHAIVART